MEIIDICRLTVASIGSIVFLVGILFPIFGTLIPLWGKFGQPSGSFLSRIALRICMFLLCVNWLFFSLRSAEILMTPSDVMGWTYVIVFTAAIVSIVWVWMTNPRQFKGM